MHRHITEKVTFITLLCHGVRGVYYCYELFTLKKRRTRYESIYCRRFQMHMYNHLTQGDAMLRHK